MSKKCYRYYGGLLVSQANWLNKMAEKGYRLNRTGKMLYEFEECTPGQYQYCVEFIGQRSKESAADYARFLEDVGYRVFFKNINLNWNVGKVVVRPWAEQGGRLATNSTTFNRELLIVERRLTASRLNCTPPMRIGPTIAGRCAVHGSICFLCLWYWAS